MEHQPQAASAADVAAYLRDAGGDRLLAAWRRRVLGDPGIPVANRLPEIRLIDHMPQLLAQLTAALEGHQHTHAAAETIGRLIWRGSDALDHAAERFDEGYTLIAVLQELSHFRSACLDLLDEAQLCPSADAAHVLHAAIDQAMTVAGGEMERLARASLRVSEERMRLLVDGATEYAIVMLSPIGIVETWNAGAQRLYGWQRAEILSAHYEALFTQEERHAQIPRLLLERAATEQTVEEQGWRLRRDASVFWADTTVTALRDREKTLRGYAVITRDRTTEREYQQAIDVAQERLRAVVEHLPAAVSLKDGEGRYVVANRAFEESAGVERGAALGARAEDIVSAERAAEERETDRKVIEGGRAITRERAIDRPEGRRELLSTTFPIAAAEGATSVACIETDVTEQKAAQATLARAVEVRDRFVAVLGHDLREPLGIVNIAAGLLARRALDPDALKLVARIRSATQRMGRLVGDMLDYARSASGEALPIEPREIDLSQVVEAAVEDLRLVHPGADLRLATAGPVLGTWDADRIVQALTNLLGNAVQHGDPGGPIDVAVEGADREASIRVANAGAPIPADAIAGIFEPFRRAESQRRKKGLGLGLYIVQQIAHAHGGSVQVVSRPERTTFEVRLPR